MIGDGSVEIEDIEEASFPPKKRVKTAAFLVSAF
jgi:hypothetical protein